MYGGLAEIIAVRLHRQAINVDSTLALLVGAEIATVVIIVISGFGQHTVGNEVFSCTVAFHNRLNQVFGHVGIVCQELLGVLGQAITAVIEAGIVVMRADARVEADAVDDGLGVQPFHLGIGVKFVEVADTQGQVGVGKELHRFGFGQTHEEGVDVFLYRPFLQECGKGAGSFVQTGVAFGTSYDDAAGIKVVVQCLAFAQEFGREDDVLRV